MLTPYATRKLEAPTRARLGRSDRMFELSLPGSNHDGYTRSTTIIQIDNRGPSIDLRPCMMGELGSSSFLLGLGRSLTGRRKVQPCQPENCGCEPFSANDLVSYQTNRTTPQATDAVALQWQGLIWQKDCKDSHASQNCYPEHVRCHHLTPNCSIIDTWIAGYGLGTARPRRRWLGARTVKRSGYFVRCFFQISHLTWEQS